MGNKTEEDKMQIEIVKQCRALESQFPGLDLLYHIHNEGKMSPKQGNKLNKKGRRKGMPDLHLPVARWMLKGLWIELKYGKNKLTEDQKIIMTKLIAQGHGVYICRSVQEAMNKIIWYMGCNI